MNIFKKFIHWGLLAVIIVYMITGFGITQYQAVEKLTFGLLTKAAALQIHSKLWVLLILFLIMHLYFTLGKYTGKIFRK